MRRVGGWLAGSRTILYISSRLHHVDARRRWRHHRCAPHRRRRRSGTNNAGRPRPRHRPRPNNATGTRSHAGRAVQPPSADMLGRPIAYPENPAGQPFRSNRRPRCLLLPGTTDLPTTRRTSALVMWQIIGPFALPFSNERRTHTRGRTSGSGYTRTPQGAALVSPGKSSPGLRSVEHTSMPPVTHRSSLS